MDHSVASLPEPFLSVKLFKSTRALLAIGTVSRLQINVLKVETIRGRHGDGFETSVGSETSWCLPTFIYRGRQRKAVPLRLKVATGFD
ncbi:hypothetical protein M378DRAFT_171874, partial [Amanita muscaria Koide BX008]